MASAVTIHIPTGWASASDAAPAGLTADVKADTAFSPTGVPLTALSTSARAPMGAAMGAATDGAVVRTDSPRTPGSAPKSARESYLSGDVEASVSAHLARKREKERLVAAGQSNPLDAPELHGDSGYIKSIVYGGLDGIITAFALTASVSGANLAPEIVLVLGFAALFANGVGMGLGDALSEQAEIDFSASERKRERWEMENHFEGEFDEMLELYKAKGISERDAATVLSIFAKYPDYFLEHMCTEELRLLPPEPDANPWKNGAVTFASFVGFGFVPLIPYLVALGAKSLTANDQFFIAIALTGVVLFVLGAVKGYLVDKQTRAWLSSAITTLVLGSFAAAIAWVVGYALESIVPSDALTSSAGA